jgi:hypothetical protein
MPLSSSYRRKGISTSGCGFQKLVAPNVFAKVLPASYTRETTFWSLPFL